MAHTPANTAAVDAATNRVLASMLDEAMELMEEISAIGDLRAACAAASPHEIGATLRAASRLARIGGWIMAQEQDEDARLSARRTLADARSGALDPDIEIGPLSGLQARIDRLAERAARMDALLSGEEASEPRNDARTRDESAERPSASILQFKPRTPRND